MKYERKIGECVRKIFDDKSEVVLQPQSAILSNDVTFIVGAIRAAKNSPPHIRHKVISDIVDVIGCKPDDLEFLFVPQNDNECHEHFDFPNSARRRQVIRDNELDAAE